MEERKIDFDLAGASDEKPDIKTRRRGKKDKVRQKDKTRKTDKARKKDKARSKPG